VVIEAGLIEECILRLSFAEMAEWGLAPRIMVKRLLGSLFLKSLRGAVFQDLNRYDEGDHDLNDGRVI